MKIGLLDSGIGGLSVLRAFLDANINATYHYIADSGHVPYGIRTKEYIDQRVITLFDYLKNNVGIDAFVIACNTATATSAQTLRQYAFDIPIIGAEPAVKPASLSTKTGHIIVAATESTLKSKRLERLIQTYSNAITVHKLYGGSWVDLVEKGNLTNSKAITTIKSSLEPFSIYPYDQFILGCTHFPFLTETLNNILSSSVTIINPAKPIANHTLHCLNNRNIKQEESQTTHFYTTGDKAIFSNQLRLLNFKTNSVTHLSL